MYTRFFSRWSFFVSSTWDACATASGSFHVSDISSITLFCSSDTGGNVSHTSRQCSVLSPVYSFFLFLGRKKTSRWNRYLGEWLFIVSVLLDFHTSFLSDGVWVCGVSVLDEGTYSKSFNQQSKQRQNYIFYYFHYFYYILFSSCWLWINLFKTISLCQLLSLSLKCNWSGHLLCSAFTNHQRSSITNNQIWSIQHRDRGLL